MSVVRGLTAAALALAVAAAAAAAPAPENELERLAAELAAFCETSAAARIERGGPPESVRLASVVSPAALARERAFLARLAARVAAAPEPAGRGAADDRALLAATVERERVVAEVVRPFQRDPGLYLTLLTGAVGSALDRSRGSACERLRQAARRLAQTPELLRAARLQLTDAPAPLIELAIDRCDATLRLLREDLPALTGGCRNARLQADLAQADTTAVRAIIVFRSYLADDLLPAARGRPPIGPEALRRVIAATLAAGTAPVDSLLADAAARVERHRTELEALAPLLTDAGSRAALDTLAAARGAPGGWSDSAAAALPRVGRFLLERELVTVGTWPALPTRTAAPLPRAAAVARVVDAPGGGRAVTTWLEAGPAGPPGAAGPVAREADLEVAREALPGRHLRVLAAGGGRSPVSRRLLALWPGEDWGLYGESMLLAEGYAAEDDRLRVLAAARALRRAGRALASLGLHGGTMTYDQARRMLEERCLLTPAEARREAQWAALDPALFGYTLGALRLRELQDEARRRLGPRYRTRAFHDAVLRCGASPHGIVRDRLWRELAEATDDHPAGTGP